MKSFTIVLIQGPELSSARARMKTWGGNESSRSRLGLTYVENCEEDEERVDDERHDVGERREREGHRVRKSLTLTRNAFIIAFGVL